MATTSHTIYSHYNPKKPTNDPTNLLETGEPLDSWQFNPAFKPPCPPPPRFVPASFPSQYKSLEESKIASSSKLTHPTDISSWYRSLTNSNPDSQVKPSPVTQAVNSGMTSAPLSPKHHEKKDKNNWFIMNVIKSNSIASPSTRSPTASLADMIARDPPPLPTEPKYQPPVWLAIGPSNKGFAMLQRSGWSEGETLGLDEAPQPAVVVLDGGEPEQGPSSLLPDAAIECQDVTNDERQRKGSRGRIALLRPIATTLKSDRLGIGLKAKTVGPHKASRRRITHNAAALLAHAKAAEEGRKRRQMYGRGRRGFSTRKQKEEQDRKKILAYLNG